MNLIFNDFWAEGSWDVKVFKHVAFSVLFLLAAAVQANGFEQNEYTRELFIHLLEKSNLTPRQEHVFEYIKSRKMNASVRTVKIDPEALSAPRVVLNISPDVTFAVDAKKLNTKWDSTHWTGVASDELDSASFVIRGENVTGTIRIADRIYSVKPIGGGLHAIIERIPAAFPDDHPPKYSERKINVNRIEESLMQRRIADPQADAAPPLSSEEISVLVAYTHAVDSFVVDPVGLIELAVKDTNQSYENSEIAAKVTLAGTQKVNYSESQDIEIDLERLSENGDGHLDSLHEARDLMSADLVVLLVNDDQYCGWTDEILAGEDSAFAVVYHECAIDYYSFAHEIGHLQGARHNPEVDEEIVPFEYGHGFLLESEKVRTIMAANCPDDCTRLPYWSNPEVLFNGKRLGSSEKSNNARVVVETLPLVSGFR